MMTYCSYCQQEKTHEVHKDYHDNQYGFPIMEDNELFGRLILEINQAGLSWETILKKQINFREAYDNFNIAKVANYGEKEIVLLLGNPGIIRNKLKINAAIYNAQQILRIQEEFGSFKTWLDHFHPMDKLAWTKHFKAHFKFVGGEIVNEFLMSTGYLEGAHEESCPVFDRIIDKKPKWLEK